MKENEIGKIIVEDATGTCYTGRNSLFPARGVLGQGLAFYTTVRQPDTSDATIKYNLQKNKP